MENVDKLQKIAEEKYDEYIKAREAYDEAVCGKFVEKYKGKFICYRFTPSDEPHYMFVTNIWNTLEKDGPVKQSILYFEGVHVYGNISEYPDSTYFVWDQFDQVKFRLHDFNLDTYEYHGGTGKSLMSIITKNEFMTAFEKIVHDMIDDHTKFNYTVD